MAITASNPGMLKAIYDGLYNTGKSLKGGKNLQDQIADAPIAALKARIITGWIGADGKPYDTSVHEQVAYNAKGIARIEARQAAQQELLQQIANSLSKGVDLQIDYNRIDASIKAAMPEAPEYELTKKETK